MCEAEVVPDQDSSLGRRAVAELIGTFLLLVGVVGSGIVSQRFADDPALALFAHAVAVAGVLAAAIAALGPVSGGHFNPAVSLAAFLGDGLTRRDLGVYSLAQLAGAGLGVITTHLMFGEPVLALGTAERSGPGVLLGEFVATAGLVLVVWGAVRRGASAVAAVPAWIGAAIYTTSSHAFANPAVSLARSLTDTYTGIRPADALAFVPVELAAAVAATALAAYIYPEALRGEDVVVPHDGPHLGPHLGPHDARGDGT